jgi:hydroxymethylpyrimidine/phosphomethylpyrimidine kinase
VLAIAGSDSGGGAGIQADLKAFAKAGVHGMTAITAITAQNTVAVEAVYPLPGEAIVAQVRAVANDIGVDAVKIGMLGTAEAIAAVRQALELSPEAPVVLDPVMVSESGGTLLAADAIDALKAEIVPLATVVTPNIPEARVLTGLGEGASAQELAHAVRELGSRAVVVTGGHSEELTDTFFDGELAVAIPGDRHADGAAHGSGCTHSSTLAARIALGDDPLTAARVARQVAGAAVRDGLRGVGAGAGPVDVFSLLEPKTPLA